MENNWCEYHNQEHGPLYVCPSYSPERQQELESKKKEWRVALSSPEWIQTQLDNGIPIEAIYMHQAMAGVAPTGP